MSELPVTPRERQDAPFAEVAQPAQLTSAWEGHPQALFVAERDRITHAAGAWLELFTLDPADIRGRGVKELFGRELRGEGSLDRVPVAGVTGTRLARLVWREQNGRVTGSLEPHAVLARRTFDLEMQLAAREESLEEVLRAFGRMASQDEQHVARVEEYATRLADALALAPADRLALRWGAMLHDVGKLRVPHEVLAKEGALSEEEVKLVRRHPQWGVRVLSHFTFLPQLVLEIVLTHHERFDGTGYPMRLEGEAIPRLARMLAVCDVFDALTSNRPYRNATPYSQAVAYLHEQRGKQFDAEIVDAFVALFE
ncbi:HD-GYP domain-containing protein [Deinococcus peraridilitoris]|nr:HD-GYP domain-containing protein [Deinococcus peraridilitoris]